MRRFGSLVLVLLALAACTHNPIPDGYTGPRANISDSALVKGSSSADMFFVSKVDGKMIDDSAAATRSANQGRGFFMTPAVIKRDIPAQPLVLTLVGRTQYGAPIQELINPIFHVSGDVAFTPEPDGLYMVKGMLSETGSSVWIVDTRTGQIVGDKIEVQGRATLGVMQK